MKNLQLLFCVLSALMLSACTNTVQGIRSDIDDIPRWAHDKPSSMEKSIGRVPTGYANTHSPIIAQPMEIIEAPEAEELIEETSITVMPPRAQTVTTTIVRTPPAADAPAPSAGLSWHKIDNYDARNPSLLAEDTPLSLAPATQEQSALAPFKYNESVKIYPLETDNAPYPLTASGEKFSREMIQQIFFPYGSSKVNKIDRRSLHELAESLVRSSGIYGLNVIGHASKHVNNVKDPIRRKMINFEMAQKRADAVTMELRQAGADPHWITAISKGDTEPNPRPGVKAQEAADRRVEIYMGGQ